jgi:transposase
MKIIDIVITAKTQMREISEEVVTDYTEKLLEGAKFPPVEVFTDGKTTWLVDGFQRLLAHQRAKIADIEVSIHKGTLRDAQFYALGVNDKHGKPRTVKDKRNAVITALEDMEWGLLSSREIAKACNVSHTFVANVKKSLEKETKPTKPAKPAKKTPEVKTSAPEVKTEVATLPPEYDPKEDQINELSVTNQQLSEENTKLKDLDLVVSEEQAVVLDEITGLRNQIKALEAELRAVKNSRDQFQNKNLELIKQVKYLENKIKKSGS